MKEDITPLQGFGLKVKEARNKAKLSQKELADKVGITHEWVCKIEKGKAKVISITLIDKICDSLDMNITWSVVDDLPKKIQEDIES
jgi:transcriptional regulator with XRE-family HTH domain